MSWLRSVSCLLSAAAAVVACRSPASVELFGESTRPAVGRKAPGPSAVFDGKTVHLRGARGETLGLNLRINDGHQRRLRLELPGEVARVTAFDVRSLDVEEPSSSMYGPSLGRGRYPDVLLPSNDGVSTTEQGYFDVAIGQATNAGRYLGQLWVGDLRIPVELSVSTARIDLEREPFVWVFYLPRDIARAHGLVDDDAPEVLALERNYDALFRAHGAFLASDLPPARFELRRAGVHDVKYWPVAIDTSSDDAIERDVKQWLRLFQGSVVVPFAIPVDEPRTPEQRLRARHIAEVIGRAGGGRPRLLRAVTDARAPVYGDSIDVYLSPANFPEPAASRSTPGERYWTYNGRPPGAGSMILDTDGAALRTWGWIAERYQVELWHAWQGLYYSDRYNDGKVTDVMRDPVTFDERTRDGSDHGNGDGVLVYPGPLPSLRLKALRRGLQDRLLLRQLAACGARQEEQRIVRQVVPRALGEGQGDASWSINEESFEQARRQVLDAIERECHGHAALADN